MLLYHSFPDKTIEKKTVFLFCKENFAKLIDKYAWQMYDSNVKKTWQPNQEVLL
ncbi:MAG: hypothetical protein RHS_1122 [Robinsoniella sp. RHS]|nr:MAG: hypothetical protein RHS_1122 [Robinsoniella sp. RHS]